MDRTVSDIGAPGSLGGALPLDRGGLRMNERSWEIGRRMILDAGALRISARAPQGESTVIDAGAAAEGGLEAGRMLAEMCMGGLGHVAFVPVTVGARVWPGVIVRTDHPAVSCMASQYAGWAIQTGDYFAMGSGPLRAHARVERELFAKLGYTERAERGVLVLEGRALPTADVARWVAERAGLDPERLTFAVAPTASHAGGVQIVARVLETALHKMERVGFDVTRVRSGIGTAPLPPVARNDLRAIGRTNDSILYGGTATFHIQATDDELAALAQQLPASASPDYGVPFREVFERYDRDFYKIDPLLFSPAVVELTSLASGRTHRAGRLDAAVLEASLLE